MKKHPGWLVPLILIAFALRLTQLGRQSLWYDEGVTWLLSQMPLPDLIDWTAADIQPPLYYLVIWATDILYSDSEWALRFPSVFFNVLTLPLLVVLAGRLFPRPGGNRRLAGLVAIFFSLSPLMVYYSQEARMYTLLVFEASLASYLLLRIYHPHRPQPRFGPLAYALVATLALYTHYFAAFFLITHLLYAGFILWRRGWPPALLYPLLQMFGLTALFFAAWLPTLFSRLGDDPSYWPGALKLDEALRKVFITFSVGETLFERTGLTLTLLYLGLLLLGGIAALSGRSPETQPRPTLGDPNQPQTLFFLGLWLILPIILILSLSFQSPKFNPRYTMLAYPAYLFLLSAALLSLYRHTGPALDHLGLKPAEGRPLLALIRGSLPLALFAMALLFLVGTSTYSLTRWFSDPRFSKADFKAMAQFIRERKAADETVLLSSGHLFPVYAYYAGWDNWTPLPWMQRLDVKRVTGLSIAAEIATAVAGKGGVWLVTWQNEVIDPNGVVPFWLDRIGHRPIDAGDFWGVGLEHWRIDPDHLARLQEDPIDRPQSFNFAGQVELVGSTQLSNTDLALFWRARRPLPDDLILTLDLTDAESHDWDRETVTGRPGAYLYPPSRWPVGEIVMTRYQLPWQIGTPPGLYIAEIGLGQLQPPADPGAAAPAVFTGWDILDEQGRPQRRTALINYLNVSHLVQPGEDPLPIAAAPQVDFLPIVAVRRTILPDETAEPGDRLLLALVWQAGQYNADNISVAFDLVDAAGQTFRVGSSLTPSRHYNLPRWKPGEVVLGQYWLNIPPDAAPGPAELQIHLINVSGFTYDEVFSLAKLEILPTERNFTPPSQLDLPLEANFSDQARLIGLACQPQTCQVAPGQSLTLTLYWRAEASLAKNYTVFTHLLDPAETVLVNADHAPPNPSQGWAPGQIIADPVTLLIPANLPPGRYPLEIGLYDAADPTFTRLPLTNGQTRVLLPDFFVVK